MLRLIFTLFLLILIPVNAMAIEINDQGAAKLKSSFQKILDYQKTSNEAFGSMLVLYDGEIKVKQEKEFYAVTLPRISFKSLKSESQAKEFTFDIGVITLNMMPDDTAGYWKTALSIPNEMTLSDETEEDIVISFQDQKIIALFNEELGYFTKINMNLSNISIKEGIEDMGINFGGAQFYTNLSENENGKFSGPTHLALKGLDIKSPEGSGHVKLGEAKFSFSIKNFTLDTLQEYSMKFKKHADTFQLLNALEQPDADIENINSDNVVDMILDLYNFDMDGFNFEYSIKDLKITPDDNGEFNTLGLGLASIGFGLDGLNSEKGSLHIKTGYSAINIEPSNPEYSDILPQNINFDIKAQNIPYTVLSELGTNSIKSIAKNPDMATMAGMGILMKLPAILSQSDTQIIIEDNGIKNEIYELTLDGNIVTDLTAMMSVSAKFTAMFKGLDKLLSISKERSNAENENSAAFEELSKILEKMKTIGKSETAANGKSAYSFEFETTPEGKMLLNGQDASTISFE